MFKKILLLILVLSHAYSEDDPNIFDYLPTGNKIVTSTKQIRFANYPNAYNPSLIKIDQGYILTFRHPPDPYTQLWLSDIGVVLLNESLDPISEPQLLNTRQKYSKTPSQSEDARIFSYRGRLFLIFNDNIDQLWISGWESRDMFIAELFYDKGRFTLSPPIKLFYEDKRQIPIQKNWSPFEWDKTLLLSYSVNPHEILYPNLKNGQCYRCYETSAPLTWDFGPLRGSTPPILVDGEYLAFFHSGRKLESPVSWGWDLWHYFMGAYTFSAEPPFGITKISPIPIIADDFYTHSHNIKRVIFPGGCVVNGNTIYLAYGKDDCEIWIATLNKKELLESLVPVKKPD